MQYLFVGLLGLLRRWFQEPGISCALQHRRFLYTGLFTTSNHMQFLLYLYICWMALWNLINQLCILFFAHKSSHSQASQGGYGVEFTQAPQSGYSGNYMNQNAHPGYSHIGTTNDIVSQVCFLISVHYCYVKQPILEHAPCICILLSLLMRSRITWPMDLMECLHKRDIVIPRKMSHLRCIMEWHLLALSSHRSVVFLYLHPVFPSLLES